MTYNEMVDHYFFQLAEEEHIDRDALTAEQQLALAEAEQQYDGMSAWPRACRCRGAECVDLRC